MCANLFHLYRYMKKTATILLLHVVALGAMAAPVGRQKAQSVAEQYLESRTGKDYSVKSAQSIGDEMYLVNFTPCGWVIIAADDVAKPIVGYSTTGSLDLNRLPDNASCIIDGYKKQVRHLVSTETSRQVRWDNPDYVVSRSSNYVEPLITVNWNQSSPYNAYCPRQEALVGCVAVAMGQAMSVQRYPSRAVGSVSYNSANYGSLNINFDEERAYNWDDILSGANNYDEVARLLYHTGMSVKMDYGEDGSGIPSNQVSRISNALKTNFSYSDDVTYYWRDQYSGDWRQLLVNELNAGRAIVYNAIDSKGGYGHSFNVDGYDTNGLFSINWGWGGYGNGYYSIDNLRDSRMNMNYDTGHVAVIGIGAPDQPLKSISLSHTHIEENLPAGSVVGAITVNDEEIKPTCNVTVHGVYQSSTGGYASVPFIIEDGMLKTTEPLSTAKSSWSIEITAVDSDSKAELTQGFTVTVDPWTSLEKKTSLSYDRQSRTFTIKTKHNVTYAIYDANGNKLQSGALSPLPELQFNAAILPAGKNVLELRCNNEIKKLNIVTK